MARHRKCRRWRPRPIDRRGCAHVREGNTPRRCRPRCSPPAPCPIGARSRRAPNDANHRDRLHWRAGALALWSFPSLVFRDLALEKHPRTQYFSDAPRLRETAARMVRCITIKYFTDRSYAGALHMLSDGLKVRLCEAGIAVHPKMRASKGPQEPRPRRAHVVRGIALFRVSRIAADISRIFRAQEIGRA